MAFFITIVLSLVICIASEEEPEGLRDMLAFVELNLMNLLEYGYYPAIYNSSFPKIKECGCYYSPRKIKWGNKIGLECRRGITGVDVPEINAEDCGGLCNDMHGFDTVLFCPPGWDPSCQEGCSPTARFETVRDRVEFWNATLSTFLLHGADYVMITANHLDECGCATKARKILYGTKIGFDCIMGEEAEFKPGCTATANCLDDVERSIVTFCPAGHRSTCEGCQKDLNSDDLIDWLEWMVSVTKGIVQNSISQLNWQPSIEQILGCACKGSIEQIKYGTQIGVLCEIHSVELIGDACGPNQLCLDANHTKFLHICPKGFTPSCKVGCAIPSVEKEEL